MKQFTDIANKIIKNLQVHNIKCYIWHEATTGSVYLRFEDNRMCSIRIGNHSGRDHLKYKYNLRSDIPIKQKRWVKDSGVWRCYIPLNQWKELIPILIERSEQIKTWEESKFSYTIPKFKTVTK